MTCMCSVVKITTKSTKVTKRHKDYFSLCALWYHFVCSVVKITTKVCTQKHKN